MWEPRLKQDSPDGLTPTRVPVQPPPPALDTQQLILALQRRVGNRATSEAVARLSGRGRIAVQRCKECTALVKDSGKAVPVYADVLEAVRMATTRNGKLERALELAREWNAHHPDERVTPEHFTRTAVRAEQLEAQAPQGQGAEPPAPQAAAAQQRLRRYRDGLDAVLRGIAATRGDSTKLERSVIALSKSIGHLLGTPTSLGAQAIHVIEGQMNSLTTEFAIVASRRVVLEQARRLVQLGIVGDRSYQHCLDLFRKGTSDHLKGLVGEYLGRAAAKRQLAGTVGYDVEYVGIKLVKLIPRSEYKGKLHTGDEARLHSAPVLAIAGRQDEVGQTIGEVDTLLCREEQGKLVVVGALESKGGNSNMVEVTAQMRKIAANLASIGAEPSEYCFAERSGDKYVDLNDKFSLKELSDIKVHSTGPTREDEDRPFDIDLGFSTVVMDELLIYLAKTPPEWWGWSPLDAIEDARAEAGLDDLRAMARGLPADVMATLQ